MADIATKPPKRVARLINSVMEKVNDIAANYFTDSPNKEVFRFDHGVLDKWGTEKTRGVKKSCQRYAIIGLYIIDEKSYGDMDHHLVNAHFSVMCEHTDDEDFWEQVEDSLEQSRDGLFHFIDVYCSHAATIAKASSEVVN